MTAMKDQHPTVPEEEPEDTQEGPEAEPRELVGYLPMPASVGEEESRRTHDLVFRAIDDLEDD